MYDVIVVGAGIGGLYAVHHLSRKGLSVVGIDGASGVGGVWSHNRYPGARVDLEGIYYSYFDPKLYREWTWAERYPSQPELLAYLNFAADTWGVKRHFQFDTWVTGASFDAASNTYTVTTDTGRTVTGRFLVMATGPLSKPRSPEFPGLDDFEGETVTTSQWPEHPVRFAGRKVGVIGTSATGVQVIPVVAAEAEHLHVFQRTPHYSVPAHNGPADPQRHADHVARIEELTRRTLRHPGGTDLPLGVGPAASFGRSERLAVLEERWAYGGHAMQAIFTDQGVDPAANEIVAEFVRAKVRDVVDDATVAETLRPTAYPIGTHRLCVDTNYYQTFNRDDVTLVDVRADPIERFTPKGIRTRSGRQVELDLVVFAIGFRPFTGRLYQAGIGNAVGPGLSDLWARGPRTYLGLQVSGLPNAFFINGPGSPSVLANFFPTSVQQTDFISDLIAHALEGGRSRIEATPEAEQRWTDHLDELARPMLRYSTPNYMVHVNEDRSRVFIPYPGGFDRHARACAEVAAEGYPGFALT